MNNGSVGKINDRVSDTSGPRKVSNESPASAADTSAKSRTTDTVELTSAAKLLERLEKTLAELPDFDEARVSEIKSAIQNGDYEINAEKIAEAMMRLDKELGN